MVTRMYLVGGNRDSLTVVVCVGRSGMFGSDMWARPPPGEGPQAQTTGECAL
jgi:hypothetical protein